MTKEKVRAPFTGVLTERDAAIDDNILDALYRRSHPNDNVDKKHLDAVKEIQNDIPPDKLELVPFNVFIAVVGHLFAIQGFYWLYTGRVTIFEFVLLYAYSMFVNLGITAGAHRLWAHRAYKARAPLKVFLLILQTLAVQNSVYEWVRDHRVHHKFTETNADPHNMRRGFFFAHMGWLLCKKHEDVKTKGKLVDLSDLEADPLIMWQHRNYKILAVLSVFVVPMTFFRITCGATIYELFVGASVTRYIIALHMAWLVNSYAHKFGNKPYDKRIEATESRFVSMMALGEGWHNYHHVFPWDYKTSELDFYRWNVTTGLIDLFAKLGLAYDLKTVSSKLIEQRVVRTGDGTHPVWGWGDKDISSEHVKLTVRLNKGKYSE